MTTGAHGTGSTASPPFHKGCGVCRRTYDVRSWEALPSVATLPADSVQPHLTVPAGFTVMLRRCTCGAVLAVRNG